MFFFLFFFFQVIKKMGQPFWKTNNIEIQLNGRMLCAHWTRLELMRFTPFHQNTWNSQLDFRFYVYAIKNAQREVIAF